MPTRRKISRSSSAPLDDAGQRALARSRSPHRPGVYVLAMCGLRRLADPARARGRPAAHRRARAARAARSTPSPSPRKPMRSASSGGYEFDTDTLRFTYSSMTTPAEVWDYDLRSAQRVLRKRQEVPSGHDPARLCHAPPVRAGARRRDWCRSRCSIARTRRSTAPRPACSTATAPMASRSRPASAPTRLSLVDRGFVYAIAHVRGGTDKGWRWYRDGKLANKTNTFTRLHRGGRASDRERLHRARPASSRMAARPAAC